MKKRIIAFALAVIMALPFISVEVMAEEVATARTIEILEVAGEVTTTRGTPRENAARAGLNLHNGHTAATGANSSCTLIFDDGSLLTMDQRSKIQVSQASRNSLSVNLVSGSLLVDAATQQEDNSVSVRVGNTSLTIRGTFFLAKNRVDGVAEYTMFEGWGEVDGIILPPLHIMRVHENIADDDEISTDVDRRFELIPFYIGEETSLFALSIILDDTDRFIEAGVISADDIPVIEDLVTDRTEEMEETEEVEIPSVTGGLIRFFRTLTSAASGGGGGGGGDGGSGGGYGGGDGGTGDGPGDVVTINRAPLIDAINRANVLMSPLNTRVRDSALSVRVSELWVTQAHYAALTTAVATATGILDSEITFNELNAAVATLDAATDLFSASRQPGLIPDDGEVFSPQMILGTIPVNEAFLYPIGAAHGIMITAFNELEDFIADHGEYDIPNFIDATPAIAMFLSFASPEEEFQFLLNAFREAEALFNAVFSIALEFSFSFAAGMEPDTVAINATMHEIRDIVNNTSLFSIMLFDLPRLEEAVQNALYNPETGGSSNVFTPDTDFGNEANESLAAANEVVRGIVIAQRADDVDRGRYWVTREVMTEFTLAANQANNDLTAEVRRVRAAFEELRRARASAEEAASAFKNALMVVENWQIANEQQILIALETAVMDNDHAEVDRILSRADSNIRAEIGAINPQFAENLTAANMAVEERANELTDIRTQANTNQRRIAVELNQSITAFEEEIRPGTRAVSVYKGELTRAILNAHEARSMITVGVGAYGALRGQRFVTLAQWNAFDDAITGAEAIWRDVDATTQQVADSVSALTGATNLFTGQIADGQQPPEDTGLLIAVSSAFNFVGSTIIAESSATVPYGTRWVPAASADDFAGVEAPWGITFDPNDLADIIICPDSELGAALYMFDRIAIDNAVTQTAADDAEIRLVVAQIETYNAGGRGTRVDLFPGEDGTKVWRLERGGSPLGYFTNFHNAQVHAIDGDTLVLVDDESLGDGIHVIFKAVHIVVTEGATLTIRVGAFSFGIYRLSNFGTIEIRDNGISWVLPGTQLDNHGTIRIHSGSTLRVATDHHELQLMDGIPYVSLWWGTGPTRMPMAMHPSQGIASGALPGGIIFNHSGAIIENQASATFHTVNNWWEPSGGLFLGGLIVQGSVTNNGTITGQVLLDSVNTVSGPINPLHIPFQQTDQISSFWMRPVNIGQGEISGSGNHGNVHDLSGLQQAIIEAEMTGENFINLTDSLPEPYGPNIANSALSESNALLAQLNSAKNLRNNQAVSASEISAEINNLRVAAENLVARITMPLTQDRTALRAALQHAGQIRSGLESAPPSSIIATTLHYLNLEMGRAITHYGNPYATEMSVVYRTLALLTEASIGYNILNPPPNAHLNTEALEALIAHARAVLPFAEPILEAPLIIGAIEDAEETLANETTQDEIDHAYGVLYVILNNFYLAPPDRTQLYETLGIAEALVETLARRYQSTGHDRYMDFARVLSDAWIAADESYNDAITQDAINEANEILLEYILKAQALLLVDRTQLYEALRIAEELVDLLMDRFEATFNPEYLEFVIDLSSIWFAADTAYNDATTQAEIDDANEALRNQIDEAQALLDTPVQLDRAALREALELAEDVLELLADAANTTFNWDFLFAYLELEEVQEAAQEVYDTATTQAEIDDANSALRNQIDEAQALLDTLAATTP